MPSLVHAIIVARPGAAARARLLRTLDALRQQTLPPAGITLVMCGDAASARSSEAIRSAVHTLVEARPGTSFADAAQLAAGSLTEKAAVWLLTHDTTPHPETLEQLAGALERSPSAALAAPKLVEVDDESQIVSYGVSMTRLGRSVELAAGEFDQGQHDGRDEVLASDVRGILVRSEAWAQLQPDRALGGADEGLDLGVRARLSGGRVVFAPFARIAVGHDGPAALPASLGQRTFVTRRAQLHRRLSYAPALAVPLHWLSFLPLALWRSILHLAGKRPAAVVPEWAAAVIAMSQLVPVARSRSRIRRTRRASWASIAPLRVTRAELRHRLDDGPGNERDVASELNFFGGGGAWAVLVALIVSVASFTTLLAAPALGGGGLLPLRTTVTTLWQDAAWGHRGLDMTGPADPFAGVIAVLGSLWPGAPSFALVLLWLLALPLAVLGGWFAATRLTERAGLRIFAGVAWALAPTFLTALVDGRPAAVLVHLLLPWLLHAGAVAHRSWGAAGSASLLLAAVAACAPSLAPALALIWLVTLVTALARGSLRGALRLISVLVPTAAVFLPLVLWHSERGTLLALLADPGRVITGSPVSADAAGRLILATGFPTADLGGWVVEGDSWIAGLDQTLVSWVPLLLAPLAVLALLGLLSRRWVAALLLLGISLSGLATAFAAVGIAVSFAEGAPVSLWPGSGLSLAWIGVVGAAVVALESLLTVSVLRAGAALIAGAALVVSAVPALTAGHDGRSVVTNGPESTLPAYVAAKARADAQVSTLIVTPLPSGALVVDVVDGASESLGAQSTLRNTAGIVVDEDISALAVDLFSARSFDAATALAEHGIHFVLLGQSNLGESDAARAFRAGAVTAMDERAGFAKVRETNEQTLWRLDIEPAAAPELSATETVTARTMIGLQLAVLLIAVLLAIPTPGSVRASRGYSRIVGAPREPAQRRRHRGEQPSLAEGEESA